jgi:hypothetical protein
MKLATRSLPLVLSLALALAPAAYAEIFKCAGHRNVPVYQNFPCEFDSLDAAYAAPAATSSSTAVAPVTARATAGRAARAAQQPAKATPARASMPRVGMTGDEVLSIWGEPNFMTTEEHAKRDIEVWSYGDSRSIEFDREQRVTAIHW